MPNQRDPDQQIVTIWVASEFKKELQDAAARRGMAVSEFVRKTLQEAIEKQEQAETPQKKQK